MDKTIQPTNTGKITKVFNCLETNKKGFSGNVAPSDYAPSETGEIMPEKGQRGQMSPSPTLLSLASAVFLGRWLLTLIHRQ